MAADVGGNDENRAVAIAIYLAKERLVRLAGESDVFWLTHDALREIEEANLGRETSYFPISIVNVAGDIRGSQVQIGTTNSSKLVSSLRRPQRDELASFVREAMTRLRDDHPDGESWSELEAQLETIQAQLKSSEPSAGIVRQCLVSIRGIAEGAAGSELGPWLLAEVPKILHHL